MKVSPFAVKAPSLWKQRLSMAYAFIGFNVMGLVLYACFKGKRDWADYYGLVTDEEKSIPPAKQWADTLGITQKVQVIRMSGFKKVGEYEIEAKENK